MMRNQKLNKFRLVEKYIRWIQYWKIGTVDTDCTCFVYELIIPFCIWYFLINLKVWLKNAFLHLVKSFFTHFSVNKYNSSQKIFIFPHVSDCTDIFRWARRLCISGAKHKRHIESIFEKRTVYKTTRMWLLCWAIIMTMFRWFKVLSKS